jgi:hypothetical protein
MNTLAKLTCPLAIFGAFALAIAPAHAGLDATPAHAALDGNPAHGGLAEASGQTDQFAPLMEQVAPMMQQVAPLMQQVAPMMQQVAPMMKGTRSRKQMNKMMQLVAPMMSKMMTAGGSDMEALMSMMGGSAHSNRRRRK